MSFWKLEPAVDSARALFGAKQQPNSCATKTTNSQPRPVLVEETKANGVLPGKLTLKRLRYREVHSLEMERDGQLQNPSLHDCSEFTINAS